MDLDKPLPHEVNREPTERELEADYEGFAALLSMGGG